MTEERRDEKRRSGVIPRDGKVKFYPCHTTLPANVVYFDAVFLSIHVFLSGFSCFLILRFALYFVSYITLDILSSSAELPSFLS